MCVCVCIQRGNTRFVGSTVSSLFVWGASLAPWAATAGLGKFGEWVKKAWSPLGEGPGLKKYHKTCSTSLHEMDIFPVF